MIRLLVDSTSDLNQDYGVYCVPLRVEIDGKVYRDGVDLDKDTFYKLLTSSKNFPKTSQPSPQDYIDIFEEVKANNDTLICILLSSALSGTYQSAILAKNIVEYDNIYIIDSLSTTYAIKIMADKADEMIREGKGINEIIDTLEELKHRIRIYASVDTLDYLLKGGRLNATVAAIGNVARLKPVITVDGEGKVEVAAKKLGIVKAIGFIEEIIRNTEIDEEYPRYMLYTYGTDNMYKMKDRLNKAGFVEDDILQIGSTIGSHVGPEAFGVIFAQKK
ncbi:MAG: DegV family protein [Erysipelotrichaceae bacterium]